MRPAARHTAVFLLGVLAAQAAWILAVPPYRGSDEFDHAYRAAGVLQGDWRPTQPAADGRGVLVRVPRDVIEAAGPQCADLPYTGPDNCSPVRSDAGGLVVVATAAGGYNPLYYAVVGVVGYPFEGATALYAMRIASSLLSALLLAGAAAALVGAGGWWTRFGLVAGVSPVLLYSTTVVAPNGLEMAAGAAFWAGCLALAFGGSALPRAALVGLTAVAGSLLMSLRMLGPVWLALALGVLLLYAGRRRVWRALTMGPRSAAIMVGVVAIAAVLGSTWTLTAGLLSPATDVASLNDSAGDSAGALQVPVWILQMVAAFPYRNQPAPLVVYPLFLVVLVAIVALGVLRANRRGRVGVLIALGLSVGVPVAITLATVEAQGAIWQGRYALPFVVGVPVLCGIAMDRSPRRGSARDRLVMSMLGVSVLAVAHGLSVTGVLTDELQRGVSVDDPAWLQPWKWVPIALVAVAFGAWWHGLRSLEDLDVVHLADAE